MKYFYKLIFTLIILLLHVNVLSANEIIRFIDVDYLIENSNFGKKKLENIKNLNKKNIDNLNKKNKSLSELELNISNKKNIISEIDFEKEVNAFQKKVKAFTVEKNQIVNEFNEFRKQELENIFQSFTPIINKYMNENSITILIDSKNIFMGNSSANITKEILNEIDNALK